MEAEINDHITEKCQALSQVLTGIDMPGLGIIRNILWETYRLAVNDGLVENGEPVSAEEVALLFDQLIASAGEVEALRKAGGGAPLSFLLTRERGQYV